MSDTTTTACPCGKGATLETCCGPIVRGEVAAPTAEALMRSRYTAYVLGEIDHVIRSTHPRHTKDLDREATEKWSRESEWLGLDVKSVEAGGEGDEKGTVEFVARYAVGGQPLSHHERGQFARLDGTWFYVDGDIVKPAPVVRAEPKVGRNDPCSCGSGKKFKRCHGA